MKTAKLLFYNLLVLFLLLVLCEIGFRITYPDYQYYEQAVTANFTKKAIHDVDTNWVQTDSVLGWVCKNKNRLAFYHPDYTDIHYQINAQGFRNSVNFDSLPPKSKRTRILLLGDSFLFGLFLKEQQTITKRLQHQLGPSFELFNMAIPGWGIDQIHEAYQHYQTIIQPDLVVLLYIDDDVSRVTESFFWGAYTKPTFELQQGQLQAKAVDAGQLNLIENFFYFQSKLINSIYKAYIQQKAIPVAGQLVRSIDQKEAAAGRKLRVVRCPRIEQLAKDYTPRFDLREELANYHIQQSDLTSSIQSLSQPEQATLFIEGDGHPSAAGVEFICRFLESVIR